MASSEQHARVPLLFTSSPPVQDSLKTESSIALSEATQDCLPLLAAEESDADPYVAFNHHGVPRLERQKHAAYLHKALGNLPPGFVMADASRPWMLYWALLGLHLLGHDVSTYRERVISTLSPMQNSEGGFGGGHGQLSHVAASYAAVLALILVGGEEALEVIDRRSLWKWLGSLKQADGGFSLCIDGEEDIRGAYCTMSLVALLNLPLELPLAAKAKLNGQDTFLTGLSEYVARCQTFEGGISGSPGTEAHGAYAFCALACLCIYADPKIIIAEYLDLPALISWLSARQYAPEGGFAGRTNKLVDGCYSHWVGGCWPLIEAALEQRDRSNPRRSLYSREGLIRYILCCCQAPHGGLRDKPEKNPDSYHSCYVLAGLSSAQHLHTFQSSHAIAEASSTTPAFLWRTPTATHTTGDGAEAYTIFEEQDRVGKIHPIFVLPWGLPEKTRSYFEARVGF